MQPFSTMAEMFLQVTSRDSPRLLQVKRDGGPVTAVIAGDVAEAP